MALIFWKLTTSHRMRGWSKTSRKTRPGALFRRGTSPFSRNEGEEVPVRSNRWCESLFFVFASAGHEAVFCLVADGHVGSRGMN
mmetsp:Transcript_56821/g.144096  ORF Transcript_56821/g.144096 Transcript_56821/m.144096 type:complete len:84 (+) Transcript_56821:680-931(+)